MECENYNTGIGKSIKLGFDVSWDLTYYEYFIYAGKFNDGVSIIIPSGYQGNYNLYIGSTNFSVSSTEIDKISYNVSIKEITPLSSKIEVCKVERN